MLSLLLSLTLLSPAVVAAPPKNYSPPSKSSKSAAIRGEGFIHKRVSAIPGAPQLRSKRDADEVTVANQRLGTTYTIDIDVGTPAQKITVILDTGSPDLWVNPSCETSGQPAYCQSFPQFDYTVSSTIQDTGFADILAYGKGNVTVEYVTDAVTFDGLDITDQIFGIGFESFDIPMGILGLSPPVNPDNAYDFVLDSMAKQGLISSRAFSLDLRAVSDPNGAVIFGGVDTGKFIGELEKLPILDPSETPSGADRYWVYLTGVGITLPDGSASASDVIQVPVFLDSGGTLSRLPTPIFQAIGDVFPGAAFDEDEGAFVVDCSVASQPGSVDFAFNNKVISVPYADFIWQVKEGFCIVGVLPDDDEPVFGDSFLRAAYVVYDQDNRNLHLAQAANCGTNVITIGSGVNAVPSSTGQCTGSDRATATAGQNLDVTQTRAPTNVVTGSNPDATPIPFGPGPAASRVSVTSMGLTNAPVPTGAPAAGTETGTGTEAPQPTESKKNDAAGVKVGMGMGAAVAFGVVNVVAWVL
ncbi:aspartic peptidase domain-containing protein [Bombardia bombarda]|uniref:Aspartic peptidase domain-containing protein n=1 Tax=Bombardia bombarda TaxID=252184 RepID=A0AA40C8N1_9PEZI|nr:aspartic peptidase domain-containing protein [Bombardia bombarda]